jgi:hypothetical protein
VPLVFVSLWNSRVHIGTLRYTGSWTECYARIKSYSHSHRQHTASSYSWTGRDPAVGGVGRRDGVSRGCHGGTSCSQSRTTAEERARTLARLSA